MILSEGSSARKVTKKAKSKPKKKKKHVSKLPMFTNHKPTVKKKTKSKPKPKPKKKVVAKKEAPKKKTPKKAIKKGKPKNVLTRDNDKQAMIDSYNRAKKKVDAKKPKPKPKKKVSTSYKGSNPILGGNRNSDQNPPKKKKKKVTPKVNGMAGLEPDKYRGTTKPKSSKVPKSKVAPAQKKVPKRVPAATPKPAKKKKPVVTKTTPKKTPVVTKTTPKKKTPVVTGTVKKQPVTKAPTTPKKKTPVYTKPGAPTKTPVTKTPTTPKTKPLPALTPAQLKAKLDKDKVARDAYLKANPTSDYARDYEQMRYNKYNDMILNNKPMTAAQQKYYNAILGRWNYDDYNDVNVQNQHRLKQDQTKALDAETVQLNKGLGALDAQAFQEKQAMQQNMATRGITDSGIAADAYARAQALNGQNYQQAYADSAQTKADISAQYTTALNDSKQVQAEAKAAQEAATAASIAEQLKAQTEQDKYLTSSTGYVYLNGKVLKDKNGKPLTSLAYAKLQEESRHNQANETVAMQKINNDLALATSKLELNYAQLDLRSQEAQANIANAQAKLEVAARNADTAEIRIQAGILNDQMKSIQKQIDGYIKADKKVPKDLKAKLKTLLGKMDKLANMGK